MTSTDIEKICAAIRDGAKIIADALAKGAPASGGGGQAASAGTKFEKTEFDQVLVGDFVAPEDRGEWMDCALAFGKHSGKNLGDVLVGYVNWLGSNWSPKGYPEDQFIQSAIEAVRSELERRKNPAAAPARPASAPASTPAAPSWAARSRPTPAPAPAPRDEDDDVPF